MKIVKCVLKVKMIFGLLQSTYSWANKKINKNRENKRLNSKTMIEAVF